jgi:hypothetical protein
MNSDDAKPTARPADATSSPDAPAKSTRAQHEKIARTLIAMDCVTREQRLEALTMIAGRPIPAFAALTHDEADSITATLAKTLGMLDETDPQP